MQHVSQNKTEDAKAQALAQSKCLEDRFNKKIDSGLNRLSTEVKEVIKQEIDHLGDRAQEVLKDRIDHLGDRAQAVLKDRIDHLGDRAQAVVRDSLQQTFREHVPYLMATLVKGFASVTTIGVGGALVYKNLMHYEGEKSAKLAAVGAGMMMAPVTAYSIAEHLNSRRAIQKNAQGIRAALVYNKNLMKYEGRKSVTLLR